ncbi:MAG: amino acid adenylation domain-containing protein [Symploca sp. SIO2G7]|nr:amino acid adenylation domain-containing protein [Symploca sp. SIO2G7]
MNLITQKLLGNWKNTQADYPNQCLHQLVESQVELTPDSIAVSFEDSSLTYRELNSKANQLARYLQTLGVEPDALVGICVERSLDMVIGLLGILKAGGAYVPLDPSYPQDRLAFMIEDSQCRVLLSNSEQLERLPEHQAKVVCLETDRETIAQYSQENPDSGVKPDNLAYTIYTSGSTGKPKGVQIGHQALVNFLTSMSQVPGVTQEDVLVAVTTISFDIAGLELYLPMIVGARVVLVSREVASDPTRLIKVIEQSGTTVMQATPATWRMLLAAGWQGDSNLKILCGGEAMSRELANQLLVRSSSVWNMYGPTETTVWSAVQQVKLENSNVPIGQPIANTQIYLVDPEQRQNNQQLQLVPLGEPGELLIGGVGLARGYLNRPELTEERFIPDPFSNQPGARLYCTGDLARYLPDDTIECLGRIDHQVKIRGFRIELGEIESALYQHPGIKEAVVTAVEDDFGEKRLVAYLLTDLSVERVQLQSSCLVELDGGSPVTVTTVDLSPTGICLADVPVAWKQGQQLYLHLQLPGIQEELRLRGTLAWREEEYAGVLFQTTSMEQALLNQSIKQILQTEGLVVKDLRRTEPRIPLKRNCLAQLKSGQTLELVTQNISRGGIRLTASRHSEQSDNKTTNIWQEGQRLRLRLQLPGVQNELLLKGTVIWHFGESAGLVFDAAQPQVEQIPQSIDYIIETQGLSLAHLRSFLKEKLPEYMLPSAFVLLDKLPLTPNLKVDRKALPAPNQAKLVLMDEFVAPRTPIEEQLAQIWLEVLEIKRVGIHDNFFDLGGHSLLTAQLLSQIRKTFQVELPLLSLFEAPTIAELAQEITVVQNSQSNSQQASTTVQELQADAVLEPSICPEVPYTDSGERPQHIFLTGATGFLGAFLLHELLQQTEATIYCLVRCPNLEIGKQKLRNNLKRYLLPDESFEHRIVPVRGDLTKPLLGLSKQEFQQLATEIDTIYHNGAFVNLIYPYTALRTANVLGTKEILKLASQVKVKPVHFISTLDVFQSPHYTGMEVISEDINLECEGLADGYAQSKWVGEQLVMAAHARGIPGCIYRPGMITGHSQSGASSTDDLITRLIKGLIQLGSAPDLDIKLSLTPVDYVSRAIVNLSQQPASLGKAFHLVSPDALHFRELVQAIQTFGYFIQWNDYDQWQAKLLRVASAQSDHALSPLLFLFTEWVTGNERPYLETAALVSQAFDYQNTLAGLAGTNTICPAVDASLLQTYFAYLLPEGKLLPGDKFSDSCQIRCAA